MIRPVRCKTANASHSCSRVPHTATVNIGTGYMLAATSDVLTGATNSTFNITPGADAKLVFGVQPSDTIAGTTITPSVTV